MISADTIRAAMRLYAITDSSWLGERWLEEPVEEAIRGGVTFVQIREKKMDYEDFLDEAFVLKALCGRFRVPFVVNDNWEIALECGADGVHVGQSDCPVAELRQKLGPDKIIGVSAKTVEQALKAQEGGADYLGVGAMFATQTKENPQYTSTETLKAICAAVKIPVVAIGGIKADNIAQLVGTGIDGVAVVSALFAQKNITEAARALREQADALCGANS